MWLQIKALWRRYGFYVSVIGCVAILGGSAYLLRQRLVSPIIPELPPAQVDNAPDFVQSLNDALSAVTPAPTPSAAPIPAFDWPVDRPSERISTRFSASEPIWWPNLEQWSLHMGVDFSGEQGEVVHAAADGRISAVYKDPLMGNVIEITHEGGYQTRYSALNTLNMVKLDAQVSRGTPIGGLGSCAAEQTLLPHVHFELLKDGDPIDPMAFFGD